MATKKFKITPDRGASVDKTKANLGGRKPDPVVAAYVEQFKDFRPGVDSFFVAGAVSKDLEFLRKPFTRAGLGLLIRRVEFDEIYQTAGVRVFRLAGEYDEI